MLICATIIYAILHGDILNPSTEEELRDEKFSFRFDCGVFQPTSQLKLRDKEHIIASISMHFCVYSCKVELDEMRRGLLSLNFIGAMNGPSSSMQRPKRLLPKKWRSFCSVPKAQTKGARRSK